MPRSYVYTETFFTDIQNGSNRSAKAIVPLVLELTKPTSVVDVGCGTGEFLKVFQEQGVDDILGIDGVYVDTNLLTFPQESFRPIDISKPFKLERRYDLAVCLEVAEHLAPGSASGFIESLTQLAPIVLFSAAIPLQGGTHHVNEQWPEYWIQLFRNQGFEPVDALRKRIWTNCQVEVYYRQNAILFCNEQALTTNSALEKELQVTEPNKLSVVHPEMFLNRCNYYRKHKMLLEPVKKIAKKSKIIRNIYSNLRN